MIIWSNAPVLDAGLGDKLAISLLLATIIASARGLAKGRVLVLLGGRLGLGESMVTSATFLLVDFEDVAGGHKAERVVGLHHVDE